MTTVPAKYVPAIQSVLKTMPYTAPEIMGTMLYERLVEPLQRKIDALTAERDQLRAGAADFGFSEVTNLGISEVGPTQTHQAGAAMVWNRPADATPTPGRPVLAYYRTAPALVYITRDGKVWADWTTGMEEPIPDYWAELPAPPEGDA